MGATGAGAGVDVAPPSAAWKCRQAQTAAIASAIITSAPSQRPRRGGSEGGMRIGEPAAERAESVAARADDGVAEGSAVMSLCGRARQGSSAKANDRASMRGLVAIQL
jgi:hypothetical protein